MKKCIRKRYEVRVKGDGELDWFIEPACPSEWDTNYNDKSLSSAKKYAKEVNGWVVEIKAAATPVDPAAPTSLVKKFVIMTPDGTRKTWVPPKMSMLGFDSGVMVLRSLMNMLPGGAGGLGQMQNMLLPMMMMGGDEGGMDMGSIMPMMLFSQMGGTTGVTDPAAPNPMAQMLPMMMMMQMMKGNKGGKGGSGFFNDRGN